MRARVSSESRSCRAAASALALAFALAALRADAAGPLSKLDVLRGAGQMAGFRQALAPREFQFPLDHGPHPEYRYEWWYVTGNLDATTGERFGFELTFFRFALAPPGADTSGDPVGAPGALPAGTDRASRWRTRQVYLAHFAITDVARREFRFAQKSSREALGLAGARAEPFRVWIDDWRLGVDAAGGRQGGWKLQAHAQDYELSLDAQLLVAPVLNGERGLSRKSDEPGAASYYYSIPRMAVHGQIKRGAHAFDVQGLAWLDREWGSGVLGRRQQGWDWFALQLQDGGTLMFYALRDKDGTRDSHSAGTWVDSSGTGHSLSSDDVRIDVSDYWTSPHGGRYPSRWRLRVPLIGLDAAIHPVLANQELGTQPRYWEGAVDVRGTKAGLNIFGRGYVELVGYGE